MPLPPTSEVGVSEEGSLASNSRTGDEESVQGVTELQGRGTGV